MLTLEKTAAYSKRFIACLDHQLGLRLSAGSARGNTAVKYWRLRCVVLKLIWWGAYKIRDYSEQLWCCRAAAFSSLISRPIASDVSRNAESTEVSISMKSPFQRFYEFHEDTRQKLLNKHLLAPICMLMVWPEQHQVPSLISKIGSSLLSELNFCAVSFTLFSDLFSKIICCYRSVVTISTNADSSFLAIIDDSLPLFSTDSVPSY